MNELLIKDDIKIENMIYEVRGKQVMLDSDLAKLFEYETFNINKAVKRNIEKFNDDYMFRLEQSEYDNLIFQNGMSKSERGGRRTMPYVFTEKGILMLATILKSKIAIEASIKIINTFVLMRKYLSSDYIETRLSNVETKLIEHDNKLNLVLDKFETRVDNHIFFKGQIYDAYSLMIDIFNTSKESILIIDNYVDKSLLDILSKTDKFITIITNKYNNEDLEKYKKQYKNVEIKISDSFHDRFIIIDNNYLYHSGASFKDLGKKCFSINRIEDSNYLKELINKLKINNL